MDTIEQLIKHRKELVLAAEDVAKKVASTKIEKTQLNHLIGICGDATCAEEIRNYVRYQAGRKVWPKEVADDVVDSIEKILNKISPDNDEIRVQAWRLYAVFLTRAYTYHRASSSSSAASSQAQPTPSRAAQPKGNRP